MRGWKSWVIPILIALGLVLLITRIPVIIAVARDEEKQAPSVCFAGETTIRAALVRAPQPVRLDGDVALSRCLARTGGAAALQDVGISFIAVAEDLSREAQTEPEGPEAVQLGYLVGAVRAGSARTQGIYDTLKERVDQETFLIPKSSRALRRGLEAGRRTG